MDGGAFVGRLWRSVWHILERMSEPLSFGVFALRVAGGRDGVAAGTPDEVAAARA
jgi:hypothetical protein